MCTREDKGNHLGISCLSLTSVPGKIAEQLTCDLINRKLGE